MAKTSASAKVKVATAAKVATKAKAIATKNKLISKAGKKKVDFFPSPYDLEPKERDAELDNICNFDTFITLKLAFTTAVDFPINLAAKYKACLTTLQIVDESFIILSAHPKNRRDPITIPSKNPTNVTGMIP